MVYVDFGAALAISLVTGGSGALVLYILLCSLTQPKSTSRRHAVHTLLSLMDSIQFVTDMILLVSWHRRKAKEEGDATSAFTALLIIFVFFTTVAHGIPMLWVLWRGGTLRVGLHYCLVLNVFPMGQHHLIASANGRLMQRRVLLLIECTPILALTLGYLCTFPIPAGPGGITGAWNPSGQHGPDVVGFDMAKAGFLTFGLLFGCAFARRDPPLTDSQDPPEQGGDIVQMQVGSPSSSASSPEPSFHTVSDDVPPPPSPDLPSPPYSPPESGGGRRRTLTPQAAAFSVSVPPPSMSPESPLPPSDQGPRQPGTPIREILPLATTPASVQLADDVITYLEEIKMSFEIEILRSLERREESVEVCLRNLDLLDAMPLYVLWENLEKGRDEDRKLSSTLTLADSFLRRSMFTQQGA